MNPEGPQPSNQVPENQPLNQPAPEPYFQPQPQPEMQPVQPMQPAQAPVQPVFQPAPQQVPPAQPVFQAAPQPTQPTAAPVTLGRKPSKKKLAILLSVIIGAIIVVTGLLIFIASMTVSKEDYRDAVVQINATSKANTSFNSAMTKLGSASSGASDAVFEESARVAREAIVAVQTENEALGKLKAVKVGEGKELYSSFDEKLNAHLVNNANIITSFEKIRPASATCRGVGAVTGKAAQVAAMKKCATDFSAINGIPHKDIAAYVENVKGLYITSAEVYEGAAGITDPYGSQSKEFRALRDKSTEVQSQLLKSSREFTEIISKIEKDIGIKEAATTLGNYLEAGQK